MTNYPAEKTFPATSRIACGCMKLGGTWDESEPTPDQIQSAFSAIEAALASGINFFDHADIYCRGKAEQIFGRFLQANPGLREKIVLQSKCGIRRADSPCEGMPARYDFSRAYLLAAVDGILSRLGVEYLDALLLHRPDCLIEPEEVAAAFDQLEKSGKVRAFGVSNHSVGQMELLRSHLRQPLIANQLEFSLGHPAMVSEGILTNRKGVTPGLSSGILDYCRLHHIRVQAWSPLAKGELFAFPSSGSDPAHPCRELLVSLAVTHGVTPEAIALAWILRHPAGIQPILGSTSPGRIRAAAQADAVELSREEWYSLLAATRERSVP